MSMLSMGKRTPKNWMDGWSKLNDTTGVATTIYIHYEAVIDRIEIGRHGEGWSGRRPDVGYKMGETRRKHCPFDEPISLALTLR